MDKELILKAVQAVMDFNEQFNSGCVSDGTWKVAAFDISSPSVRMSIHNGYGWDLYVNAYAHSNEEINNFIQKLDELKAV